MLDTNSVIISSSAINLFVGLILFFYIRQSNAAHLHWCAVALSYGIAGLLIGFREFLPDWLSIVISNMIIGCSIVFVHRGAFIMLGKRPPDFIYATSIIALGAIFYYYTYISPDVSIRLFTVSSFRIPYFICTALVIRSSGLLNGLQGAKALIWLLLVGAAWYLFRGSLALSSEAWAIFLRTGSMQGVNFLVAGVLNVMVTVSLFRIEAERAIAEKDITSLALQSSEAQYKLLFQNMIGGFAYHKVLYNNNVPVDYMFIAVNSDFTKLTGLTDVVGKTVTEVIPGLLEYDPDLFQVYFRVAETGTPERFEKYVKALDQWFSISVFSNDRDHFAVLFDNITERKLARERIEFLAFHDGLTGLPNRILTKERMRIAISFAECSKTKAALMLVDLDNFKTINDTFGHQFGDDLLVQVAARLSGAVWETVTVGRNGADEFLVVIDDVRSPEAASGVAESLLQALTTPFEVNGQTISVSASIGLAMFPEDGRDFDTLLRRVDTAMYQAKEIGRNTYRTYDHAMISGAEDRLRLRHELRRALEHEEFTLYYQPQIDLRSGGVIGAEALIRWNHPELGLVSPGQFIPAAEEIGLIIPMGEWAIREACHQMASWHNSGLPKMVIAVNLSALQFKRGNLESSVETSLADSNLDPTCLELELTESLLIKDVEAVLESVKRLKQLGLKLSIDDFGTGYSSLAYLKRFKVDKLKIDQSFIRDLINNDEDATIVRTIIQMAANLNLKTIAEGVENAETLEHLRRLDCDEVQGYHIARPMPAGAFEIFIANNYSTPRPQ